MNITKEELTAFKRFCETCEDGQEYDVEIAMMERLAAIGLVRKSRNYHYCITDVGMRVLEKAE